MIHKINKAKILPVCSLLLMFLTLSCTGKSNKNNGEDISGDVFQSDFSFSQSQTSCDSDVSCDVGEAYTTRVDSFDESFENDDDSSAPNNSQSVSAKQDMGDYSNDIYDDWSTSFSSEDVFAESDSSMESAVSRPSDKPFDIDQADESSSVSESLSDSSADFSQSMQNGNGWTEFY